MDTCRNPKTRAYSPRTHLSDGLFRSHRGAILRHVSSLAVLALGGASLAAGPAYAQQAGTTVTVPQQMADTQGAETAQIPPGKLPPRPAGRTTVIGGRISKLDAVRDQFDLKIYGGQSMKVLFDARTHLYRDGVAAPMRSLRSGEAGSVETSLDGTTIFADTIHILSQVPEGECSGQVENFDPRTSTMTVHCDLTQQSVRFLVSSATVVERKGQATQNASPGVAPGDTSLLMKGALVSVTFEPGNKANSIATHVRVVAVPGMVVVFTGDIVSLDQNAGRLVVTDEAYDRSDDRNYDITFVPGQLDNAATLAAGSRVKVTAQFDGNGYTASAIEALRPQ